MALVGVVRFAPAPVERDSAWRLSGFVPDVQGIILADVGIWTAYPQDTPAPEPPIPSENIVESSRPGSIPVHPYLVMEWETRRPSRTLVHELFDHSEPVVSLRAPGTRRGVLKYFFRTLSEAQACEAMHRLPAVFTLTADISDLYGQQLRYVVADGDTRVILDVDTAECVVIEVPYIEVPA